MVWVRACFLVLIAVLLMVFDHRSPSFHRARQQFSVIVYPIQTFVNTPIQWVHWLGVRVSSQQQLLKENAQLKARELLLQSKLQKLITLEHENAHLKNLLQSSEHVSGKTEIATLLAVDMDPSVQQIVLDKGRRDHVFQGQPVLDAYGVMGQVIDVGVLTSKVLLLTDPRFAISVRDQRNGFRAIAAGKGSSDRLALLHVSDEHKVAVGDLFVTSGLGLHFPAGYPVGVVAAVKKNPGTQFADILLVPTAHFDQTQQVILVWPNKKAKRG